MALGAYLELYDPLFHTGLECQLRFVPRKHDQDAGADSEGAKEQSFLK